ncbi:hypothetical protein H7J77_15130 [Mycolicibacillus parakoreensis]|uniref:Uncharacterized protein n=1 Tax=Mycolicibacillus parakoreensis TaxID=1069221 RepID=A0ABY3TU59_9MYCO|nr:hypothetical protein [Mycolicibacillus parakoreensis]MCV7316867.1 hypothetical protein [Mycolicibacillus parakoreensis]ULN51224.1 hypothetical protein MIU77_09725 [Mycolicibacillus parakoreensis]HLR98900.1 hypothetical protein [Mycolicibacillus parakoreensis]
MLIIIAQVALLTFLALALGVIAVVFLRRVRRNGFPDPPADPSAAAFNRALYGPRPLTPLPEWADRDEADEQE